MLADLKSWRPVVVAVLMEALLVTVHDVRLLGVLNSECVIGWLSDARRVHDGDGFVELGLVPQLVMQIYRGQEDIILRVSVYPAQGDDLFFNLHFKQLHFISHHALVATASLGRDD